MRIVLNTSPELDPILAKIAKETGTSINQILIDDAEEKYLQRISTDTACLNDLIDDANEFAKISPFGTPFTVSDLNSINNTALQDKKAGRRSAQRASVTRRLIRAVKDGTVPNVCCLVDSNGNAVKLNRNSAFITVEPTTYKSIMSDKVITAD